MPGLLALAVSLIVPLTLATNWETLSYRGIPVNRVSFAAQGLTIAVRTSASPVVWPLPDPRAVRRLVVAGRLVGTLNTTPARQGQPGADDFALRVGLVVSGARRPSPRQRLFAPRWIQRLLALAPRGGGIEYIQFFSLGMSPAQIGWSRVHPQSALVREVVVAAPERHGQFAFDVAVPDLPVLAIWLSADGDDTHSTFIVHVDRLELGLVPQSTPP